MQIVVIVVNLKNVIYSRVNFATVPRALLVLTLITLWLAYLKQSTQKQQ